MTALGRQRRLDRAGAVCGIAAGTVALMVPELLARRVEGASPPLRALGEMTIRLSPSVLTRTTIEVAGRYDKLLLQVLVLLVALAGTAGVGVLASRNRGRPALALTAALALVPLLAVAADPDASLARSAAVLVPGALLGLAVLHILVRPLRALRGASALPGRTTLSPEDVAVQVAGLARRQVLQASGIALAALTAGQLLSAALRRPPESIRRRLAARLPAVPRPLPALGEGLAGAAPLLTPTASFYRVDIALEVPFVEPDDWHLQLRRDGKELASYSYDELVARARTEADVTLCCVDYEVGGDLVGTARWQGVLLADLLAPYRLPATGRLSAVSADGFRASFPLRYATDGRPAMVAIGMNGRPLPVRHGFPARLVVPGLYGFTSAVKWLVELDVSPEQELPGFWADRGWTPGAPIRIASRIDTPEDGDTSDAPLRVAGVAWAPVAGVAKVEVAVDDGPWRAARLSPERTPNGWRQFALAVQVSPGERRVRARATDTVGQLQQAEPTDAFPDGTAGLHEVTVRIG